MSYEDNPLLPHLIVWPVWDEPDYSGLLNSEGYPLVRTKPPVGFINFDNRQDGNINRQGMEDRQGDS